jgi:hypothetical protein
MRAKALILACALPLSACVTTHDYAYTVTTPGPPYAGTVAIYLVGAAPKGEFTEIAVVQAERSGGELEDVLPALQARAAQLGCDVLLHVRIDKGESRIVATGMAARSESVGVR